MLSTVTVQYTLIQLLILFLKFLFEPLNPTHFQSFIEIYLSKRSNEEQVGKNYIDLDDNIGHSCESTSASFKDFFYLNCINKDSFFNPFNCNSAKRKGEFPCFSYFRMYG